MTIGIAASGPNAGEAIVRALAAVEAVGEGAVGGFVSLAAIAGGTVHRAETQTGGIAALGAIAPAILTAPRAVLMSSGPNRPAPLAQFTPGDPAVGLVTGHRFPNSPAAGGLALNVEVLELMRQGLSPDAAIAAVLARNPMADAGLIALAADGAIHFADGPLLDSFGDRGAARLTSSTGASVAVLHNAIRPYRGLALLAAEIALDLIEQHGRVLIDVTIAAGLPIIAGAENAVELDGNDRAVAISVADPRLIDGRWSFGLGYRVKVRRAEQLRGRLAYEPYLVSLDGHLLTIDGATRATVPAVRDGGPGL